MKNPTVNAIIIRKWCHYGLGESVPSVYFDVERDADVEGRRQGVESYATVGDALTRVRDLLYDDALDRPVRRPDVGVGA